MDLIEAFNLINNTLLKDKLMKYTFCAKINKESISYLSDKEQIMDIVGILSNRRGIRLGVPEGLILDSLYS